MHWARWGDPGQAKSLSDTTRGLVEMAFGPVEEHPAVALEAVSLPAPLRADLVEALVRLVGEDHVLLDHETRVRHTRGKSTPDLLRIRAGDGSDAPDAVVRPADHDEVAAVVEWCSDEHVALVPFGGGTSVVGGLAAQRQGYAGVIALDLGRLTRLVAVDPESRTAVLEAGLLGPEAESLLGEHGFTLGHFPQSFEYASIGGYAATRSSGQASSGYGRFDSLVLGVRVATPVGTLDLGRAPGTAAGPDLRELVLGSEGAFGVITAVTVRVRPVPEVREYEGWRFPTFRDGAVALRELARSVDRPTVLRLSDESETAINLVDPGSAGASSTDGCLMVVGYEGTRADVDVHRERVGHTLDRLGGEGLGEGPGVAWLHGRYQGPYLRDALLDVGVLVETLETAAFWSRIDEVYGAVRGALETALTERGTPPLVLCHISHVYETGASLYFTVAAKETGDPLAQWASAKGAATDAMVRAGATITHHHGVGRDHKPWLSEEVGNVGVEILRAVKSRLDPGGILNPGVLVP